MPEISVIGAGIAGLTTAIALNAIGKKVMIFESAPQIKAVGAGLGMGANAIKAFEKLGLKEEVISKGRFLKSFTIYDQKGKPISRLDSTALSEKYGVDNFTIHRAELHKLLLSKIDRKYVLEDKKVAALEQKNESVTVRFADGSTHETGFVIAADGIHSKIRLKFLPASKPRYAGYTCWRSVIENSGLDINETSETWGSPGRFGIVPLADNKIYWFACIKGPENDSHFGNFKITDLQNHFKAFHQPIPAILNKTQNENLLWNDIIDIKPINTYAFKNVLLIGDAAHATTPNLGQGACQAIEDAVILAAEVQKNPNLQSAFKQFEKRRMKRTHYIIETSRRVGKIAQISNPFIVAIRNTLARLMPASVNEKQLEILYKTDF